MFLDLTAVPLLKFLRDDLRDILERFAIGLNLGFEGLVSVGPVTSSKNWSEPGRAGQFRGLTPPKK